MPAAPTREQRTPGPWHVYEGTRRDDVFRPQRTVCAYEPGRGVAVAYCDYHTPEIAEANARLIAAAPDYDLAARDALDFLEAHFRRLSDGEWENADAREVAEKLSAAISKAEGRP